jgi:hypothetical protein
VIPWDSRALKSHPVVEGNPPLCALSWGTKFTAIRLYEKGLLPEDRYFLRFSHPIHLQDFLKELPKLTISGRRLEAKLFKKDADVSRFRPFSVLQEGDSPMSILRPRQFWSQELSYRNPTTLVTIAGIPFSESAASVDYWARILLKDESFEWAYPWHSETQAYVDQRPTQHNVVVVDPRYFVRDWRRELILGQRRFRGIGGML